jgi:predicted MFS family arabinose efflux permease
MLLWSGQALSELGSQVSTVAYPLLVLALTGSAAKAGVVGFAKLVPLTLFALPSGVIADRIDRKRLMMACDGIRAIALASIPIAFAVGQPAYLQVVAVAFIDGALFATSYITERGALHQLVPSEQLPQAVAQNQGRTFAASIAGPPLGGLLFSAGRALPFLVDAVSYSASTVGLALIRRPFQAPRTDLGRSVRREIGEGFTWLWQRPFFRTAVLLFAGGNALFSGVYLLAILLAKDHGASSASIGVMFAIVGAGGVIGALLAGPLGRRLTSRLALVCQEWSITVSLPLLLIAHSALAIGVVVAATELLTPVTNSKVSGLRIGLTPSNLQGRVQAASTFLAMSLGWLGPLAAGFLFQGAGSTAAVLAFTGWVGVLALIATLSSALREDPGLPPVVASEGLTG